MKREKIDFWGKKPLPAKSLSWSVEQSGNVVLYKENKGFFNKAAQKIFKKPRVSQIHLDEFGSFVWQHLDGDTDMNALGQQMKNRFGERAEPLYERLQKYFEILFSYGFVEWAK